MVVSNQSVNSWKNMFKTKETILFFVITLIVIALDQLSKFFIEQSKFVLNFLFIEIKYSTNTGAGFGILQNNSFMLGVISLIATIIVIYYYPKLPQSKIYSTLTGLFLGGIVGNGIDRLTKQYVVDFIATSFWPSFNVADSAITIAAIGFIILIFCDTSIKPKEVTLNNNNELK